METSMDEKELLNDINDAINNLNSLLSKANHLSIKININRNNTVYLGYGTMPTVLNEQLSWEASKVIRQSTIYSGGY